LLISATMADSPGGAFDDLTFEIVPRLAAELRASSHCTWRVGVDGAMRIARAHPRAIAAGFEAARLGRAEPIHRRCIELGDAAPPIATRELVGVTAFRRSRAYRELYRAHDIEHVLVARCASGTIGVTFGRSARGPAFGPRETQRLGRAMPALEVALRGAARLEAAEDRIVQLETLLERLVGPVALVGGDGRLLWASGAAMRVFEGATGARGGVPSCIVDEARRLGRTPDAVSSVPLPGCAANAKLTRTRTRTDGAVVVVEIVGERNPWNLTRAESDVLGLVGLGLRNEEIAQRLFISPATARTHLYRIFKKLGVTSRTQAAVLVTGQ
jgi:DNA-binding CsgD family transcriptional regulator